MQIDEIRSWGARIADWAVRYLSTVRDRPVRSPQAPGTTFHALPAVPPEKAEDFAAIFADFEKIIRDETAKWAKVIKFAGLKAQ